MEIDETEAPRHYGAILPPELVDEGRAWQRTLFAAGGRIAGGTTQVQKNIIWRSPGGSLPKEP